MSAILELQQKTGLKNVLLEKKLEKLSDLLEQREAQINEILAASQLEPDAVVNVNEKLEVLHFFLLGILQNSGCLVNFENLKIAFNFTYDKTLNYSKLFKFKIFTNLRDWKF